MNPDWAKVDKKSSEWNYNEKAAAYLCSPVNATNKASTSLPWKNYYDEDAAEYVIGGPSVEMYVKSYNEAYKGETLESGEKTPYTLGANYRNTETPGYIYTVNGSKSGNSDYITANDTLDCTKFNSMYCGKDCKKATSALQWWLASPSAGNINNNGNGCLCFVSCDLARLDCGGYSAARAVSPLVSLKSNFIPQVEEEKE